MPAASVAGQPPPFNPQSGWGVMTPMQQDVWAAGGPARQQSAKYQEGHDQTMASLRISNPEMTPEAMEAEAHLQGMRWAGLPFAHLQEKTVDTIDEVGNPVREVRNFDPISGSSTVVRREPLSPKAANDRINFMAAFLGPEMPAGATPQYIAAHATPEQRQREETAWAAWSASAAGQRAAAVAAQQPQQHTTPGGGIETVIPAPQPPPVMKGSPGPGGVAPPAAPAAAGPPAAAGVVAPKGGQVGQSPGNPEAPVHVPEGITSPDQPQGITAAPPPPAVGAATGAQAPTPRGEIRYQSKPDVVLDPATIQEKSSIGNAFIDAERLGTNEQATLTRKAATDAGIPVIDPKDAALIRSISVSRENMKDFNRDVLPFLATTALTKPGMSLRNAITAYIQTPGRGEKLASLASHWMQNVENVKTSGASRTTGTEIKIASEGLPDPDRDTLGTALNKIQTMQNGYLNMENSILPLPPALFAGLKSGAIKPGSIVTVKATGQEWHVDDDGVPHRVK
jgi:hypothetical protein